MASSSGTLSSEKNAPDWKTRETPRIGFNARRFRTVDTTLKGGVRRETEGLSEGYSAMALRAAIRPNTTHSPMLPVPWYILPQIEPNSPAEYRFSIGLPYGSRMRA